MKILIQLAFQFYKLLLYYNIAFSLLGIAIAWYGNGRIDAGGLFLAKILGFTGGVILYHYYASATYYYFRNVGCRMRQIIALAFIADFTVYFLLLLMFNLITHTIAYFGG